jgi:hypothetical protein
VPELQTDRSDFILDMVQIDARAALDKVQAA